MAEFDPESLARWAGGRWTAAPSVPICGFAADSRQVTPGQLFVALKTEKRDGHAFLEAAQSAGASAALVAAPVAGVGLPQLVVVDPLAAFQAIARRHRLAFQRPVVGITGSAGKTSTKDLLAILLGGGAEGQAGGQSPVLATQGNLNNHIGVPLTLTRLDPAVHTCAVIEAGISAPGEMAPLAAAIEPDVAIITLVAPAHLKDLGTLESVAREKAALAARVRRGGVALFPSSCARFAPFRELKVPTIVVGRVDDDSNGASVVFSVNHREGSTEIVLRGTGSAKETFVLPRVSDGMAQNAALAIHAARRLGVRNATLQDRLPQWKPAALRGEVRRENGRLLYLDCYNANPASMSDALAAFSGIAPEDMPRLYLIGCMEELGADAGRYHRELGAFLKMRPKDTLVVLGDWADEVGAGAIQSGAQAAQILAAVPRAEVSARLAAFHGAVFAKGSRKHQLENLFLPC
jgi:UDP-N-acetylmuramoyl-tripeptide--D-alanyl-D-alanine ligase